MAELHCYYAEGSRRPERPHCQGAAVVAYGSIALCSMCDAMRSAVGRTDSARKLPGAELNELGDAARVLVLAERRVNEAVQSAGWPERHGDRSAMPLAPVARQHSNASPAPCYPPQRRPIGHNNLVR